MVCMQTEIPQNSPASQGLQAELCAYNTPEDDNESELGGKHRIQMQIGQEEGQERERNSFSNFVCLICV